MADVDTVNAVHGAIVNRAAEIGNAHQDKPPEFIFKPLAVASTKTADGIDGFCLEWDGEGYLNRLSPDRQRWVIHFMERIGQEAIRQAIVENKYSFVSVILSEAKQGRNYFDFFNNDTTMDTIS